jgi:hypothetical protein
MAIRSVGDQSSALPVEEAVLAPFDHPVLLGRENSAV